MDEGPSGLAVARQLTGRGILEAFDCSGLTRPIVPNNESKWPNEMDSLAVPFVE